MMTDDRAFSKMGNSNWFGEWAEYATKLRRGMEEGSISLKWPDIAPSFSLHFTCKNTESTTRGETLASLA